MDDLEAAVGDVSYRGPLDRSSSQLSSHVPLFFCVNWTAPPTPRLTLSETDRRTLIRRVTFDLSGLPPTPEEVRDFLQDTSTTAYNKVVDRLLASPRYAASLGRGIG
jgi:hypothetical protein